MQRLAQGYPIGGSALRGRDGKGTHGDDPPASGSLAPNRGREFEGLATAQGTGGIECRFDDHEPPSSSLSRSNRRYARFCLENIDTHEVQWPEEVKSKILTLFNRCVARVVWPASVERPSFSSLAPMAGRFGTRSSNPMCGVSNRSLEGAFRALPST